MSKSGISTAELIALTNESQTLITPSVLRAFNAAATAEEKKQDSVLARNTQALRNEARVARTGLRDEYQRMICMAIIERTNHGISIAIRDMKGRDAVEIFNRVNALDGKRTVPNKKRADDFQTVGAYQIAALLRQAA